jgi:hypothetical protein
MTLTEGVPCDPISSYILQTKTVNGPARRFWMAMAMAVPSRLWLGGVISPRRDLSLIMAVVGMVRRAARSLAFLVCVDGLASSVTAFVRAFRGPVRTGKGLERRKTSGILWPSYQESQGLPRCDPHPS